MAWVRFWGLLYRAPRRCAEAHAPDRERVSFGIFAGNGFHGLESNKNYCFRCGLLWRNRANAVRPNRTTGEVAAGWPLLLRRSHSKSSACQAGHSADSLREQVGSTALGGGEGIAFRIGQSGAAKIHVVLEFKIWWTPGVHEGTVFELFGACC